MLLGVLRPMVGVICCYSPVVGPLRCNHSDTLRHLEESILWLYLLQVPALAMLSIGHALAIVSGATE